MRHRHQILPSRLVVFVGCSLGVLAGCLSPPPASDDELERLFFSFADADNQMHLACFYDGTAHTFPRPRRSVCLDAMAKTQDALRLLSENITVRQGTLREALTTYASRVNLAERELRSGRLDLAMPSSRGGEAEPVAAGASSADAMQEEISLARSRVEAAMAVLRD